jgi:hypothetical protein
MNIIDGAPANPPAQPLEIGNQIVLRVANNTNGSIR